MKRILLICTLLLGSSQLFAQGRPAAILRVRLNNGAPIMVLVDGRHYEQRGSAITIGGLPPGRHRVAVYRAGGRHGYGDGRPRLVYEGMVRTEPGTFTTCMVDAWRSSIAIRVHDMDRDYNDNQDWYNRQDDYNGNYGPDRNAPGNGGGYSDGNTNAPDNNSYDNAAPKDNRPYSDREPDNIYNNGNSGNNAGNNSEINRGYDDRGGYSNDNRNATPGMSSDDLNDLQRRVEDRMTDTDKEKLLKTALKDKAYSSADIATILSWLSFDSTRIDFAKWAYIHVADQQNYYKTEDALSFSGSKTELDNFINGSH